MIDGLSEVCGIRRVLLLRWVYTCARDSIRGRLPQQEVLGHTGCIVLHERPAAATAAVVQHEEDEDVYIS